MQDKSSLRKAALLVRSLDADSAAVLLSQLSPTEAKAVRLAMREIHEIDPDEQASLRDELSNRDRAHQEELVQDTGVELELSVRSDELEQLALLEPAQPAFQQATSKSDLYTPAALPGTPSSNSPFAWLEGGDLPRVAEVLQREHISTVAIVLSHLPPPTASQLLAILPADRRSAALERLAELGDSDKASVEVIEKGLADWITSQKDEQRRRADRIGSVQAILRHSTTQTYAEVIADISSRDQHLAKEIRVVDTPAPIANRLAENNEPQQRPVATQAAALATGLSRGDQVTYTPAPRGNEAHLATTQQPPRSEGRPAEQPSFDFDRLVDLSQSQLAELFRHCQADSIVLALAGSSEAVTKHVRKCLPRSVAKELMRRINQISAISLTDVGRSQQQISATASRLFGAASKHATAAVPQPIR